MEQQTARLWGLNWTLHLAPCIPALVCFKSLGVGSDNLSVRRFNIAAILVAIPFACLVGVIILFFVALSLGDVDEKPTPFKESYNLKSGGKVVVSGEWSGAGFHGNYEINYRIDLKLPGHQLETLTTGYVSNEREPTGPFRLITTPTRLYIINGGAMYSRRKNSTGWQGCCDMASDDLRYFGRAIMPTPYTHNEYFATDIASSSDKTAQHHLPQVPLYTFERFGASENIMVLLHVYGLKGLWPRRLVYRNGRFDLAGTLALQPKFHLRPLSENVSVEILRMRFPESLNWHQAITRSKRGVAFYNYNLVTKLPGAIVLSCKQFRLNRTFQPVAGKNLLATKRRYLLRIKGFCGDPNLNLVHFKWKIGNRSEAWEIAHNGRRFSLWDESGVITFARFSWAVKPLAKTRNHAVREPVIFLTSRKFCLAVL